MRRSSGGRRPSHTASTASAQPTWPSHVPPTRTWQQCHRLPRPATQRRQHPPRREVAPQLATSGKSAGILMREGASTCGVGTSTFAVSASTLTPGCPAIVTNPPGNALAPQGAPVTATHHLLNSDSRATQPTRSNRPPNQQGANDSLACSVSLFCRVHVAVILMLLM